MSAAPKIVEAHASDAAAPAVYVAIADIIGALAHTGIAKGRKNQQQGFQFRGIDDVYNALAALLAEHRLVTIPRTTSREIAERQTGLGKPLFYVTVGVDYDLVSAVDGSKHTASVVGEGMDMADKATSKAMSAAYKYMALQVFCIPTEGDNDAEATTHEVAAIMPDSEYQRLRIKVRDSGGDGEKWDAYMQKRYPQGVPMSAHANISAEIDKAAAARAEKAEAKAEPADAGA